MKRETCLNVSLEQSTSCALVYSENRCWSPSGAVALCMTDWVRANGFRFKAPWALYSSAFSPYVSSALIKWNYTCCHSGEAFTEMCAGHLSLISSSISRNRCATVSSEFKNWNWNRLKSREVAVCCGDWSVLDVVVDVGEFWTPALCGTDAVFCFQERHERCLVISPIRQMCPVRYHLIFFFLCFSSLSF